MRVMVLVKATAESEAGVMPSEQLLTEMGKYNDELIQAGIMLAGEGLHPSAKGARVRFSGKNRTVIDGPFTETKELVAGFWMWQVKSLDEAIQWVKRCPNPMLSDSEIEIRPVFEMEDFGDAMTPELRQREERQRQTLEQAAASGAASPAPAELRFEQGKPLLIAGLNGTYSDETRNNIPAQWSQFVSHLGKIPGQVGRTAYGVCWNFGDDCKFDYLCGVEVSNGDELPEGFTRLSVPVRKYAVLTHHGHVSTIPGTFQAIEKCLKEAGHQSASGPCFERYTEEFDPHSGLGGMEVWVPVQA